MHYGRGKISITHTCQFLCSKAGNTNQRARPCSVPLPVLWGPVGPVKFGGQLDTRARGLLLLAGRLAEPATPATCRGVEESIEGFSSSFYKPFSGQIVGISSYIQLRKSLEPGEVH
ncbi:hypothetical protein Bbelb_223540 [Branchiostoma belcheri]|nr:hypothetical protein Bbelb_223540 [Branchiostoma belcheri]